MYIAHAFCVRRLVFSLPSIAGALRGHGATRLRLPCLHILSSASILCVLLLLILLLLPFLQNKLGTARVVVHKELGVAGSYTLEVSFNT